MGVFLTITGLIFLFCYFNSARFNFQLTWNSSGNGAAFTIQIYACLNFTRQYLVYHYENIDLKIIPTLDRAAQFTERLKKRSRDDDIKAYLIRWGFYDYPSALKTFCQHARIEKVEWKSQLGCQDAMYTGILTGITWAIKGIIISLVSAGRQPEKLQLEVVPRYDQEIFISDLHCIIKMRIVHIIFIAAYMLFKIVRGYINGYRPGKAKPSHRRTYENGYAKY